MWGLHSSLGWWWIERLLIGRCKIAACISYLLEEGATMPRFMTLSSCSGCQAAIEGVARGICSRERANVTFGLKRRPIVAEPPKVKMRSPFSGFFPKMV